VNAICTTGSLFYAFVKVAWWWSIDRNLSSRCIVVHARENFVLPLLFAIESR